MKQWDGVFGTQCLSTLYLKVSTTADFSLFPLQHCHLIRTRKIINSQCPNSYCPSPMLFLLPFPIPAPGHGMNLHPVAAKCLTQGRMWAGWQNLILPAGWAAERQQLSCAVASVPVLVEHCKDNLGKNFSCVIVSAQYQPFVVYEILDVTCPNIWQDQRIKSFMESYLWPYLVIWCSSFSRKLL